MSKTFTQERGQMLDLRDIQLELADMLSDLKSFNDEHGLKFTLAYGTVLGAVRHKGFIPWDDDLDVYMLRDDYERLIDYFEANSSDYCRKYDYICERNSTCPFLKIMSKDFFAEEGAMEAYDGIGVTSLWIDVFPLDPVSADIDLQHKQFAKSKRYMNLYLYSRLKSGSDLRAFSRKMKRVFARAIGTKRIVKSMHSFAKRARGSNGQVGDLIWMGNAKGDALLADEIVSPAYLQFEGAEYPVPRNYKGYLSKVYGNYMQLPPEDERRTHGLRCWKIGAGGTENVG